MRRNCAMRSNHICAASNGPFAGGEANGAAGGWSEPSRSAGRNARRGDCCRPLSCRALNVLKILACEMTGEVPERDWSPPDVFVCRVTFECLANARNCGPRTTQEIIEWAEARGITIAPPCWAGRSFPQMWRHLEVRFAAGELTRNELTDVLKRSARRKNTKIPVSVQRILVEWLKQNQESCAAGQGGETGSVHSQQKSPAALWHHALP
jgi:hypothetical protein